MNDCQFPVFIMMTVASLLSFLASMLWAMPKIQKGTADLSALQKQQIDLQIEKLHLEKSISECTVSRDQLQEHINGLKKDLLKAQEENQYLHNENKMLETRVKTLEVILKEIEDFND